jgi:hypothetical protein
MSILPRRFLASQKIILSATMKNLLNNIFSHRLSHHITHYVVNRAHNLRAVFRRGALARLGVCALYGGGALLGGVVFGSCASTSSVSKPAVEELSLKEAKRANNNDVIAKYNFPPKISLDDEEALRIGYRIWQNECNGSVEGLSAWNNGEEFASMGIGHFIWFPQGCKAPFGESFPQLVDFLLANSSENLVPVWLRKAFQRGERFCPWRTREEFYRALESPKMRDLRQMLASTVALQARFIARRTEASLQKILSAAPAEDRARIQGQFFRLAATPSGLYALADYVNFKGEGVKTSEHYAHRGWGLLQVLQGMRGEEPGEEALREFAVSAEACLLERVQYAPLERREYRWLEGWKKRLRTYTEQTQ